MNTREFKALFGDVAKAHGFAAAHGGWYQRLPAIVLILDLQRSNFGKYFELNLKFFVDGVSSQEAQVSKQRIKRESGDVFVRPPKGYRQAFDLESALTPTERKAAVESMFSNYIAKIAAECISPVGLLRLRDAGVVFLLPGVEAKLRAG